MVLEKALPQFSSWIGQAALWWLIVIGGVAVAALVLGGIFALVRHGPSRAAGLTARALADAWRDLIGLSPRRVGALAWLAVKESIRRKVLVGFLVFVVLLLFASWFLDPESEEPARLYLSFVLNASSYLVLLLLLFLSVFSIPADIRSRTLHTIVTKPVRASEIVLGRMLGFTLVGTGLLGVMAFVSYWFVVRGMAHTHELEPDSLRPISQVQPAPGTRQPLIGETKKARGHRHTVRIDSAGQGRIEPRRRHWHELQVTSADGNVKYTVGPEQGSLRARVPVYGTLSFVDREGIDAKEGISVGYEWTYRSYIQGGSPAAAVWLFRGLRPEMFHDHIPVELNIEVFRTHKGNIEKQVLGSLALRNPDTGLSVRTEIFEANEFLFNQERATKPLVIPLKLVNKKVSGKDVVRRKSTAADGTMAVSPADPARVQEAETLLSRLRQPENEEMEIDVFRDLVTPDGRVEVWLQCVEPGQYFGAAQGDLYLPARDALFFVNLVKGYAGIWMQMVLIIGFGVMFSTFLSGPVAMIATGGVMVLGLFKPFMLKVALGEQLGGGPFESIIRIGQQTNLTADLAPTLGTEVAKSLDWIARLLLQAMASVLPSFGDFSFVNFVAYGFNIDGNTLLVSGVQTLAFFLPVFVAGYFFMKMREVAR